MTFEEWCKELDRIGREQYNLCFDYTVDTGTDCWEEVYRDGVSPEDAIAEDFTYGD